MKAHLIFLTIMLLFTGISKAQNFVLLGNQSECEQISQGPPEFKCAKYLNDQNGYLSLSDIQSDDESAVWEMNLVETGDLQEEYFTFRNLKNGKLLCIENGSPQCNASDGSKYDAQWGFWETDVATGIYYLLNRSTYEILAVANGSLILSNDESALKEEGRYDSKYISFRWVIAEPDNKAVTDPNAGTNVIDEKTAILDAHNYWRGQLGIAPLVWSDELAIYAQDWADQLSAKGCNLEHRKNGQYGENLYWAMGADLSGVDAVNSWAEERKDFDVNTQEGNGAVVGHYTQIIWENSTKVGCAMVKCSDGSVIWVCNYDPPGNYSNQKPWKKK